MPSYTVINRKTGEEQELMCSYQDLEKILKENPDLQQRLAAPKLVAGTGDVRSKTPDGFKDVLRKVKQGSGRANTIDV
jgi:hypothetical protein